MGNRYRSSVKRAGDRFTNIPNYVLDSVAVRTLSPAAFKVLVYLVKRCYGAKDNGRIVFGARFGCRVRNPVVQHYEELSIGLSKSTIAKALAELELHGLIRCTKPSTFGQKRMAREWRLTWVKANDELPTQEFLQFKPVAPAKTKASPFGRTVMKVAVHRTGQWQRTNARSYVPQSTSPDYYNQDSPADRTRSYQCNGNVSGGLFATVALVEKDNAVLFGACLTPPPADTEERRPSRAPRPYA